MSSGSLDPAAVALDGSSGMRGSHSPPDSAGAAGSGNCWPASATDCPAFFSDSAACCLAAALSDCLSPDAVWLGSSLFFAAEGGDPAGVAAGFDAEGCGAGGALFDGEASVGGADFDFEDSEGDEGWLGGDELAGGVDAGGTGGGWRCSDWQAASNRTAMPSIERLNMALIQLPAD